MTNTLNPDQNVDLFYGEKHKSLGSRIEQTLLAVSRNEDL